MSDRDNEGAIWRNDKRQTNKHPHFTGRATVEGVEYWVAAWKRDEGANEKAPALKFKLTPKEERQGGGGQSAPMDEGKDFDTDIPFVRMMTTERRP